MNSIDLFSPHLLVGDLVLSKSDEFSLLRMRWLLVIANDSHLERSILLWFGSGLHN
jgi:hypothetical protein